MFCVISRQNRSQMVLSGAEVTNGSKQGRGNKWFKASQG